MKEKSKELTNKDIEALQAEISRLKEKEKRNAKTEEQLRFHLELEEAASQISKILETEYEIKFNQILSILCKATRSNRAYFFEIDHGEGKFSNTYECCDKDTKSFKEYLQNLEMKKFPNLLNTILEDKNLVVKDINKPNGFTEHEINHFTYQNIKALLAVPVKLDQQITGFLGIDDTVTVRDWDEKIAKILKLISEMITAAWERIKHKLALVESEELFRTLTNTTTSAIFIVQGENFQYMNDTGQKMCGYSLSELQEMKFWDIVHPDHKDIIKNRGLARQKGEALPNHYEFKIITAENETKWVDFSASQISYNGTPAMLGTAFDITESVEFEEKLKENEAKYRALFLSANDAIFLMDKETFIDCNPKTLELFECEREDIIGAPPYSYSPVKQSDGRDSKTKALEKISAVLRGTPQNFEWIHKKLSGEEFFAEVNLSLVEYLGKSYILAIVRDVNERELKNKEIKDSRDRLEILFEKAPDAYFLYDLNGNFVDGNRASEEMIGYEKKELIGQNIFISGILIRSENNEKSLTLEANIKGEPTGPDEFYLRHKNGNEIIVEVSTYPVKIDDRTLVLGIARDITEKKRIEQALRKNEERFRSLFENSTLGIYRTSIDGRVLLANDALVKMLGYNSFDELAKVDIEKNGYKTPEDRLKFKEMLLEQGELKGFEQEWKRADGTTIFVRESSKLIRDKKGNPIIFEGTIEDISEKKAAEKALRESEKRFRNLFENATVGIYRTTPEGKLLLANQKFASMFGYSSVEKFMKRNVAASYSEKSKREKFKSLLEENETINGLENEGIKADGSIIYFRESARVVKDENGNVIYYEGIAEDITEKKKIETELSENLERYKQLFNISPAGILLLDNEGYIINANDSFCKMMGYALDEILGKSVEIFIPQENKSSSRENIRRLIRGEKFFHSVRSIRKDGTFRYMELNETRIPLGKGKMGILSISNDITERYEYEKKLIEAKDKAEQSDRLKTEFLAQMSHEIRTPINIILSYISLLESEFMESTDEQILTKEELTMNFDIIKRAGERIIRTIELLLNMSEIQTGNYNITLENIDIIFILENLISEHLRNAKEKGLELKFESDLNQMTVKADEYSVNQIFDNLINNAVKYTKEGEVKVKVDSFQNGQVVVDVSDTGIGISEEFLPNLFQPFIQEEQGYTRKYEGNGLGLALVKRYCDMNNAEIKVYSRKGEGTTFRVIFSQT
jgi:PAS domain S-box-containing protein